jgi:hypothetical protein
MSFQGYLDTIKAKTGKGPEEFVVLAERKGLLAPGVKPAEIITWLKDEYGLGRGHAMAIVSIVNKQTKPQTTHDDTIEKHFIGKKTHWRPSYDALVRTVSSFGTDTDVLPGASYLSLRKAGKKFAIVQVTADRLDVGIKLKNTAAAGRLETAGSWNAMVTHRVRIHTPTEIDKQLLVWLKRAYEAA